MPKTKEQFEEMRNATRTKIQSSAMRLFVQKGFGAVKVQEIADEAGISIGLLYRHYKTKEDLFNELVKFAVAGLKKVVELFESDESPIELMNLFVNEVYHDMISSDELANLAILMSQSFMSRDETNVNQNEVAFVNSNLINATSSLIKRGQNLSQFVSGDSYEMALYFFAVIQGLAYTKIMLKDSFVMPSKTILTAFLYKKGE